MLCSKRALWEYGSNFPRAFACAAKRTAAAHRRRKKRLPCSLTLPESLNQNLQRYRRCSAPRLRARLWLERQASCPRPLAFCRYAARPTDSGNETCVARQRSMCCMYSFTGVKMRSCLPLNIQKSLHRSPCPHPSSTHLSAGFCRATEHR